MMTVTEVQSNGWRLKYNDRNEHSERYARQRGMLMSEEEKDSETTEDEQSQKDKAVKLIERLFTDEFRLYFSRSTYEQGRAGQTFICSVCTDSVCDDGVHWKECRRLRVYHEDRTGGCKFPHTVCFQDAHSVRDKPNVESIRGAVEREWDYIKDVDNLR